MNAIQMADLRRLFLIGVPLGFALLLVFHPLAEGDLYEALHDHSRRWLVVHVTQLAFIGLLALVVYLLVEGISGHWASISRMALLPFGLFYGAFEAVAGIGTGVLVDHARDLPPDEQSVAAGMIQVYWESPIAGNFSVFSAIGALSWLVATGGAILALRQIGAPRSVLVLLGIGGLMFGISHAPPLGPTGLLLIAVAVARLGTRSLPITLPDDLEGVGGHRAGTLKP